MAIHRKCKYCKQPISIREMPAGQWVAFDLGTDSVHRCGSSYAVTPPAVTAAAALDTGSATATSVAARSSGQVLRILTKALKEHRCVRLVYYTAYRSAFTDRVVEPIALKTNEQDSTILQAYCRWRQDIRSFAISNIRRAELLEEKFSSRTLLHDRPIAANQPVISGRTSTHTNNTKPYTASKFPSYIWWLILTGITLWLFFSR